MLHYDDSSRNDWAVAWFSDPRCTNGNTWLVLDDGRVIELVIRDHQWVITSFTDLTTRVVGHDEQAIWTAASTPQRALWGSVGRKVDPTGRRADGRAIISVCDMRDRVFSLL